MGLFAEIERVWITVDNRLYFWNYRGGSDLHTFDEMDKPIISVALIPPKKGMFIDSINHLLLLVTVTDLYIIALAHDNEHNTLEFFETGMTVSVKGLDISHIVASQKTGRIFMTGDSDGTNLWEIFYSNVETWFKGKCSKTCHTRQYILSSITPTLPTSEISVLEKVPVIGSWVKNHEPEKITSIEIDDSRNLIYTLSNLSTIRMYFMDPRKTEVSLLYTYKINQIISHLKMIPTSQDHSLQPPNFQATNGGTVGIAGLVTNNNKINGNTAVNKNISKLTITSINIISSSESTLLNLIAITDSGSRIYIKAANTTSDIGPPTTMQAIQQRFPPVSSSGNTAMLKGSKNFSKIFPPGYFFAVVPSEISEEGDKIFVAAPDSGKIIHQMTPGSNTQYFENACFLDTEGFVHDISLLTSGVSWNSKPTSILGNESRAQYITQNPKIAILTNTGIHVFARRYPYQIFEELGQDIRPFFEFYGRTETCANALSIASQPTLFSHTETEFASKVYIELGGKPHLKIDDENTYSLSPSTNNSSFGRFSAQIIVPSFSGDNNSGDIIRLSGRFDGLATYVSRIVSTIWNVHPFATKNISISSSSGKNAATTGASVSKTFYNNFSKKSLERTQLTLVQIAEYLEKNRAFIDGLSGEPNNLVMSGRSEEISLQAEHRGLHSLVKLITSMREGLSFLLLLLDESAKTPEGLESITKYLPSSIRDKLECLTFKSFFTSPSGADIAKELITCLVNRNVSEGGSVDTISVILQDRCVSYCSPDDVIIYKALECLHKAESLDFDSRLQKLGESLRLFQKAASSIHFDVLKDAVNLFVKLRFYPGAVELALTVAQQEDRGNLAVGYLHDDKPEKDPRKEFYEKRLRIYELIFEILEVSDQRANESSSVLPINSSLSSTHEDSSANVSSEVYLRNETYDVCHSSRDEVFHYCFYDWFIAKGVNERLLEVDTPYIQSYLEMRAKTDISIANLLWVYYKRHQNFYSAAQVLLSLAKSSFDLSLSQRIEYLSRARNYCGCPSFPEVRQGTMQLGLAIQDYLDLAIIQDEILKNVIEDDVFELEKKNKAIESLENQLLDVGTLFNSFAFPLDYHEICIQIFYTTDYRGSEEINNTWNKLIFSLHKKALSEDSKPYELISQVIQRLGQQLMLAEFVFPSEFLISRLETYTVEYSPDSPQGWIVETFLNSGLSFDSLFTIYKDLVDRREYPFDENNAYKRLAMDVVYLLNKWINETRSSGITDYVQVEFLDLLESVVGKNDLVQIRTSIENLLRGKRSF